MVKYTRPVNSRVCYGNVAVVIANPSAGGVQMEGSQKGFGGCRAATSLAQGSGT